MNLTLKTFLTENAYSAIKLKFTKTKHFEIKAKINGVKGNFILDTGASQTCLGFNAVELFSLNTKETDEKATGAGASNLKMKLAMLDTLQISRLKLKQYNIALIDLSHVNSGLLHYKAKPIHGIIGADLLHQLNAIIDYEQGYLYLKKQKKIT